MRMKRDYMGNDQLLPAYNVQIGVADEYIAVMDVQQYRSDMDCFVPLLERFRIQYGFYPGYPVADAGYGSYNNYLYCRDHEMELFMKFPMYEKETKDRKYSTDPFRAVNFQTNEQGELICPNGRRMQFSCRKAVKGNHYGRIVTSAFLGMAPSYRANLKETVKTAKSVSACFQHCPEDRRDRRKGLRNRSRAKRPNDKNGGYHRVSTGKPHFFFRRTQKIRLKMLTIMEWERYNQPKERKRLRKQNDIRRAPMIKAVMFDMGGTLEDLYSEEKNDRATAYALYDILQKHHIQVPYEAEALWAIVGAGIQAYKKDSERTLMEARDSGKLAELSVKYFGVDREKLAEISEEIAHMWETTFYDRSLREHAAEMLRGLKEDLGLHVAVVSNTGSLFQVFSTLEKYGVRQYFDEITLSSIVGYRKPHPNIFRIACAQADLDPAECAFVGDTLSRDVVGPRRMGFGRVFKINSFLTPQKDLGKYDVAPDYQITDIYDVYTILKQERDNA